MQFDAEHRLVEFPVSVEKLPDDDWHIRRWCNHTSDPFGAKGAVPAEYMSWQKRCTLMKGPLLLAKSKRMGVSEQQMFEMPPVKAQSAIKLSPVISDGVWKAWHAEFSAPGSGSGVDLCDYASAVDDILDDPAFFTVWM